MLLLLRLARILIAIVVHVVVVVVVVVVVAVVVVNIHFIEAQNFQVSTPNLWVSFFKFFYKTSQYKKDLYSL